MKYALSFIFCIAFFLHGYNQKSWEKTGDELIFSNAPFKECHASSIVEVSPGNVMATFFGGSQEGANDVTIWVTTKANNKWSRPVSVADGKINDSLRYPCWNPVLFKDSRGIISLFYKVGAHPSSWWGMVITSGNMGKSWSSPQKLADEILGPIKNKPVQLTDGTIVSPSSSEANDRWSVHIERSTDSGKSWKYIPVDSNTAVFRIIQPTVLVYPYKRLQILCRSNQDCIVQAWSDDNGEHWGRLSKLNVPNPNSGIDAVTLKDGSQLLVYNPTIRGQNWFNNRGKLNVAVSKDGIRWSDVMVLENDGKKEFSYPAVIQTEDGKVHITYTYDRKNIRHVVLTEKTGR